MTGWTSWCYDLVLKKKEMKKKQNKSLEEKNRLSFCSRDWNSKMTIGCQKTKQTCSRTEWMALHLSLSFLFMEIVWLKRLCKLKYADQWIGLHDHELAYNCNQNWIPDTNSFSLKEERFVSSSFLSLLYRLWHRSLWQEQFLFYFFFGLLFFFFSYFYFVSSSCGGPRMFYPFWIRSNAPSVRVPESSGDWGAGFLSLCSNGRRGKESVDRSVTTKWTLSDSGSN